MSDSIGSQSESTIRDICSIDLGDDGVAGCPEKSSYPQMLLYPFK